MKKLTFRVILFSLLCACLFSGAANAAWIWTPETKKFTNPKNAVKDTPKEQFEWAMSFYNAKDYQRASFEFDKLARQYEFSDYASKSQYYVGLCYENMQKYYTAYENYQKAIDNFPHLSNTDEVLAREYAIGLLYLDKPSPRVMGNDIMAPLDRAVEIFKKVVENAPYGKYAEDAQFKLGEALKKSERYEEAIQAYHKISEDYPNSKYVTQAMYEESHCAYRASLKPAYDATTTDNAIKTFEKFVDKNKDTELAHKADNTMKRLKDNVAQKSFDIAKFYEDQGKTQAAIIYYQDVIDAYPESSLVNEAKSRIEAVKNKGTKKAAPSPLIDKKKQKLSWNLFGLTGKKQEKKQTPQAQEAPKAEAPKAEAQARTIEAPKTEPETPVTTEAPMTTAAPKIEPVAPIAEVTAQVAGAPAPQVQEKPKRKAWTPFKFEDKKEKKAAPVEKKAVEKKPWKPFSLFGSKKAEEAIPRTQETSKKKGWTPFKFDDKKEKKIEKPAENKPAEKKPWKPLNLFGAKKTEEPAPKVKEAPKKAAESAAQAQVPANIEIQKPEVAEEPKPAPVTQIVQKVKVESEGQVVESVKVEPVAPAVEAPTTEPATPIIETPKQEEPVPAKETLVPQVRETPKKKTWAPFNFEDKKAAKPADKKPAEKKPWKPLNFSNSTFGLFSTDKTEDDVDKKIKGD